MQNTYQTHLLTCFEKAEKGISNLDPAIMAIPGMTGEKTRHFYNNVCNMEDMRYLEVGTYIGSSVCSAMNSNKGRVVCIDNWSEFTSLKIDDKLVDVKQMFKNNVHLFKGENDFEFIERDCFQVDVSKLGKFNIFMYDGDHSIIAHYKALKHFYDCLDDVFIYIVDDWNFKEVQMGTYKAIHDLGLKVHWFKVISTESNGEPTWWNGIYAAVLQK